MVHFLFGYDLIQFNLFSLNILWPVKKCFNNNNNTGNTSFIPMNIDVPLSCRNEESNDRKSRQFRVLNRSFFGDIY